MKGRFQLHASMVISTLALFVALGGTAVAATNMINGSDLVNHSVAGKKLEPYTITGAQVKVSTFPMVPSAEQATDAATAKYAHSAGSAATATNANYATKAGSAVMATTAENVDGHTLFEINVGAGPGDETTLINDVGGLTLTLMCAPGSGTGTFTFHATTGTNDASIGLSGIYGPDGTSSQFDDMEGDFDTGITFTMPFTFAGQFNFSYHAPGTGVVSGTFAAYDEDGCAAYGNADSFAS